MSNLRKSLTVVALVSLVAVSLATAKGMTRRITFFDPVNVGGVTLKAGEYTVKISDSTGSETDVVITGGKQEVKTKASWVSLDRKASNTSVLLDSQRSLMELRFAGKDRALSFSSRSSSAVD